MGINWGSIVEKIIAGLIVALLLAMAGFIVGYAYGVMNLTDLLIALFAVGIFAVFILVYILASRRGKILLATIVQGFVGAMRWLYQNRQATVGALMVLGAVCTTYALMRSWAVAIMALVFALGVIMLTRSVGRIPHTSGSDSVFQTVQLPVGKLTNASLAGKYLDLPLGNVNFGGIPFFIDKKGLIFDTSEARWIEADGKIKGELPFAEPQEGVQSVHILINAGGAFKVHKESNTRFAGLTVGKIELRFSDETSRFESLVLGRNLREWAIGNFPDQLVDTVSDPRCEVAWRGVNRDCNYAVIDRLEISLRDQAPAKPLKSIAFVREIPCRAPEEQGGNIHFFVAALTLEKSIALSSKRGRRRVGAAQHIELVSARFGKGEDRVDVTKHVSQLLDGGRRRFIVHSQVLGVDETYLSGVPKDLEIVYVYRGKERRKTVSEGEEVVVP